MRDTAIKFITIATFNLLTLFPQAYAASSADNRVTLGIQALRSGDYNTAQQWLFSAQEKGTTHPDLELALGLSYYYSNDLKAAMNHLKIAANGKNRYEAAYYLGEIYTQLGSAPSARSWYEIAASQYEDTEIQHAADQAILRLQLIDVTTEPLVESANEINRFALVSAESSYSDGLINPDDSTGSASEDSSVSVLLAGGLTLLPIKENLHWKAGASFYTEKYSDFSDYNVDAITVNTDLSFTPGSKNLMARIGHTRFNLNDAPYLDQTEIRLENQHPFSQNSSIKTTGKVTLVSSPNGDYEYSAGTLYDFGAELRAKAPLNWRLGISARRENRGDVSTTITLPSNNETATAETYYSRDWIKLSGRLSWKLGEKWRQNLGASWRVAQYHNADSYLASDEDTSLTVLHRETQRLTLKTELTRALTNHLDARLGYQYLADDANNNAYDFNSHTISAGVSYLF